MARVDAIPGAATEEATAKDDRPSESPLADPLVTVCIVAGHGRHALEDCVASLARQSCAPPFELLVADSGGANAAEVVRSRFPAARVWRSTGRLPGAARNPLVKQARGHLLLFLDDDVTAPPDLLSRLVSAAEKEPGVTVFGGPNVTPPGSSRFQVVQGAVLASLMGAGPVSRRYGPRHAALADERWFTLCNLAIRREAMTPFDHELVCAEENAVLAELRRRGEAMRYDPSLMVFHERRPTVWLFARQMFKYGWGRGALIARSPRTARLPYLGPAALVGYLAALPVLLASGVNPRVTLAPAAVYMGLVSANAARIGWTLRRSADVGTAIGLTVLLHVCYGSGVLRGVLCPERARGARGPLG